MKQINEKELVELLQLGTTIILSVFQIYKLLKKG